MAITLSAYKYAIHIVLSIICPRFSLICHSSPAYQRRTKPSSSSSTPSRPLRGSRHIHFRRSQKARSGLEFFRCDHVTSLKMKHVQWVTFESRCLRLLTSVPVFFNACSHARFSSSQHAPFTVYSIHCSLSKSCAIAAPPLTLRASGGAARDRPPESEPNVSVLKHAVD